MDNKKHNKHVIDILKVICLILALTGLWLSFYRDAPADEDKGSVSRRRKSSPWKPEPRVLMPGEGRWP
jgi:hypothetical protein